jgi:peptide/nickel transport system substrate-binding protein
MNAVRKKSLWWAITLIMVLALMVFTTGCRSDNGDTNGGTGDGPVATPTPIAPTPVPVIEVPDAPLDAINALAELHALEAQFPRLFDNPGTIVPGGDFHWVWGLTSPIVGLLHPHLSENTGDSDLASFLIYSLLPWDDSPRIMTGPHGHNAPAYLEIDLDNLTATITMRDGIYIYWHDGVLLTLDDLVYAYEFISHPDYTGVRFGPSNGTEFVIGAEAFRAGEVDYIAGLVLREDQRQLTIHYTEMPPGLLFGLLSTPIPRHHFVGIPVSDMAGHMNSRDNLLGFGPFYIESVVPGESYVFAANPNYWQGRPILDRVIISSVDPEFMAEAARAGHADLMGFRLIDWPYHNDMNNMEFLGRINNSQGPILHFMHGEMHSNPDTGELYIIPRDDGHPITDRRVRRAMAYAIDRLAIDVNFNNAFGRPATSVLSPFNGEQWIDPYSPGLSLFDLDRANQILDDAGYVMGPDGFRLDLNGNPFHVNFAMWHSAANEIVFAMHQQNMRDIGIDFRLYGDTWIDWNQLTTYMMAVHGISPTPTSRNSDMHMWQMHWSHSGNPSQSWLWGNDANFNVGRFTAPDLQAALDNIDSTAAWDPEFLGDAMRRFAASFDYHVPAITASWTLDMNLINHRVVNYTRNRSWHTDDAFHWHLVGLTDLSGPIPHR